MRIQSETVFATLYLIPSHGRRRIGDIGADFRSLLRGLFKLCLNLEHESSTIRVYRPAI